MIYFCEKFTKMSAFEDFNKEISLFKIPDWLKNSEFASSFFKEIEHYKPGTQEWLDKMSEKIPVKIIPPQSYEINNIKSFNVIMETSDFFGYKDMHKLNMKYPLSIYAYTFVHTDEVKNFLRKENKHLSLDDDSNNQEQNSNINLTSEDFKIINFFNDINNN